MSSIQEIKAARDATVASVRAYCTSQVDLWRKVPWLALQADGRSGAMGSYERAYYDGLWAIDGHTIISTTFVDCDTGALVRLMQPQSNRYQIVPAWDDRVLQLATKPGVLTASLAITSLTAKAAAPRASYISKDEALKRDQLRAEIAHKYSVTEIYTRIKMTAVA